MQNQNTKVHRVLSLLIYGVLCIFVLAKGAIFFKDTTGFLAMDFHRSIGYNAFLKAFTSVFGDNFGYPVIIVQLALLIAASYYLLKTINAIFNLQMPWVLVLQFIIIAPAFYLHYVANSILSEGLAYPFFLIFVALVLKGFVLKSSKHYYYALAVLLILLLTRGQFIAMMPMLLILITIEGFQNTFNKKTIVLLVAVVTLPLISGLISKTYNKLVYDHFDGTPFSNVSLITAAFYVSDADDYKLFANPEEQQYFKDVYAQMEAYGLTKAQIVASEADSYQVFHAKYSKICNWSIHELAKQHYKVKGLDENEQLIAANNLAGNMLMPLLKDNVKAWIKLYVDNLKNAFGSAKQLLLYLLIGLASFVFMFKQKDMLSKFIFTLVLMLFANSAIVPLAAHSIKRYLFYTDWMIFAIVVLLLNEIFTKKPITK